MSADSASRRTASRPGWLRRSIARLRLPRFQIRNRPLSSPENAVPVRREGSPYGTDSTLITSAPKSDSIWVAYGPAMWRVRSTTLTPSSGFISISSELLRVCVVNGLRGSRRPLIQCAQQNPLGTAAGEPSVDGDLRAADVRGGVGNEKGDELCDLARGPGSLERNEVQAGLLRAGRGGRGHRSGDVARVDRIDADAERCQLRGRGLRESSQ